MARWRGAVVNEFIAEPDRPGPWVNQARCLCCGADYRDHRQEIVPYSWDDAVQLVRSRNGGSSEGGGYRSRGPVLWALRVLKLADWYAVHAVCGELWNGRDCIDLETDAELLDEDAEIERFEAEGRRLDAELADLPGWETDEEFGF